jgi:hypothetical protein
MEKKQTKNQKKNRIIYNNYKEMLTRDMNISAMEIRYIQSNELRGFNTRYILRGVNTRYSIQEFALCEHPI